MGYADDMVILAREWTEELTGCVESRLEGKFGLAINREKTRVAEVKPGGGSLDFPVYTFGRSEIDACAHLHLPVSRNAGHLPEAGAIHICRYATELMAVQSV